MNHNVLLFTLGAYILGAFNTSYYLIKWKTSKDIRSEFTGTAGATNASRILGRKGFITVFLIDFLKGYIAAAMPNLVGYSNYIGALLVLFVAIGHVYPIQLSFRGGKGLAVVTGGIYYLDPWIGIFGSIILAISVKTTHKKTMSTMGLFVAISVLYHTRHTDRIENLMVILSCCLIIWCHRSDLKMKKD